MTGLRYFLSYHIFTHANACMISKQGYALKNWAEELSDEAFYPWESPKKIRLKSVNPTFVTEEKKVSIHW